MIFIHVRDYGLPKHFHLLLRSFTCFVGFLGSVVTLIRDIPFD